MKPTDISQPNYFHKIVDCQWACPAHTPVPHYIRLIAERRYAEAAAASLDLDLRLAPPHPAARWLMTGNQAVAVGALRGRVRFVRCYPITPATDLVEWMAPQLKKLGGRLALAEDELAAINMVLSASNGGVPAMTVTSGPGLSLMVETIGLGIAAEIPAVIVNVMRGGPSTGIPSKTEQSDVNIAVYGGHGDAPRIVLAPTSVRDCMFTGEWTVYLAEFAADAGHRSFRSGPRPGLHGHRPQDRSSTAARAAHRYRKRCIQALCHRFRSDHRDASARNARRPMGRRGPHPQ